MCRNDKRIENFKYTKSVQFGTRVEFIEGEKLIGLYKIRINKRVLWKEN